MKKQILAVAVAMAMLGSLGLSTPSKAGTYISTVIAQNTSGGNADEFVAAFSGTHGSITGVNVVLAGATNTSMPGFTPVAATAKVIDSGAAVQVDFTSPLPTTTGLLVFQFLTSYGSIGFNSVDWKLTAGSDPPGSATIFTSAVVPEPGSITLLGIGMMGLLSCRRFLKRKSS
jgi:hypothetical protein